MNREEADWENEGGSYRVKVEYSRGFPNEKIVSTECKTEEEFALVMRKINMNTRYVRIEK